MCRAVASATVGWTSNEPVVPVTSNTCRTASLGETRAGGTPRARAASRIPDPEPRNTPRPSPGVQPGETPPGESSTGTGAVPYRPLTRGWAKGPLLVICLVALECALFFLAYAIMLNL
ncbi:DUF6480 family protein [Streptomyces nojiriensis]